MEFLDDEAASGLRDAHEARGDEDEAEPGQLLPRGTGGRATA